MKNKEKEKEEKHLTTSKHKEEPQKFEYEKTKGKKRSLGKLMKQKKEKCALGEVILKSDKNDFKSLRCDNVSKMYSYL